MVVAVLSETYALNLCTGRSNCPGAKSQQFLFRYIPSLQVEVEKARVAKGECFVLCM